MVRKELYMASIYEQIMDNSHIRSVKEVCIVCMYCVWDCVCVYCVYIYMYVCIVCMYTLCMCCVYVSVCDCNGNGSCNFLLCNFK